jgi:hypothetical protein
VFPEGQIMKKKDLFELLGREGKYNHIIPDLRLYCPPVTFDPSIPGHDALAF